jgi:hypothetical protein
VNILQRFRRYRPTCAFLIVSNSLVVRECLAKIDGHFPKWPSTPAVVPRLRQFLASPTWRQSALLALIYLSLELTAHNIIDVITSHVDEKTGSGSDNAFLTSLAWLSHFIRIAVK